MPTMNIRPSRSQMSDMADVCQMDIEKLHAAAAALREMPLAIERDKITETLAQEVGKPDAELLGRVLFSVAGPLRQDETFAQQAFDALGQAILDSPRATDFKTWPSIRPIIEEMVGSKSVRLAAKAIDVSYDFERLFLAGRFLTTIRPIFNDNRTEILGATIVHTLRLEYISSDGQSSTISVAFDRNEILKLHKACDEALRKGDVSVKAINDSWKIPVTVPGETIE